MNEHLSVSAQIAFLAIQLGVIIFASRLCGRLAQKLKTPPVLGELVAGILIGPYLLGAVNLHLPGFEHGLFPLAQGSGIPVSLPLYGIAMLGSIILLFMSGLETDLRMFFRYSVAGTLVGMGGVVFSFAFGAVMGMVALHAPFMDPRCLFLGILSTATSVGITARILSERKSIDSPEGTTILAAAVIDDVLGIICLAVVVGIVGATGGGRIDWTHIELIAVKSVGIWLGATALGLLVAHRVAGFLKRFRPSAVFGMLAFALALIIAGAFEQVGLAMIVGAYVMGLSLSKTDISFSVQRALRGVYDFLVPVFFVVMGMLVDVRVLGDAQVLKLGLIYSVLAILAKIIGCALPALFMNFNALGALRIGVGMIPRGEVALIIAGIGATTYMTAASGRVPIIGPRLFGVAIIMTLATTLVAPPLLSLVLAIRKKGVRREQSNSGTRHTVYNFPSEQVADFLLRMLIDNFRNEGFRHSEVDRDGGLTHFRREGVTFTLQITGTSFDFESSPSEVLLIRTVMYETIVELYRTISKLEQLAAPEAFGDAVLMESNREGVDTAAMRLGRIIRSGCVTTELRATCQSEAIRELVALLERNGMLVNAEQCVKDVLAREAVVSTCVGDAVALPHARTSGTDRLVAAVGISQKGYREFGDSGKEVKIVILSVCPCQEDKPYLQFVSLVAAKLNDRKNLEFLAGASDAESVRTLLIRTARKSA